MIAESIVIAASAVGLDLAFGDPRSRYHPTAWVGSVIARITPMARHQNRTVERIGGILVIGITVGAVLTILAALYLGVSILTSGWMTIAVLTIAGSLLLKSTVAIRGMERHALAVMDSLDQNNLDSARASLSMIVKRDTKSLDKSHVISGVLESISENTVDGITGPLFYFAVFGIPGAFVYRVVNTADSMIGYQNSIFRNVGWFAAKCDTLLNYIPSRLTGLVMILSVAAMGHDWRASYGVMIRDAKKTSSTNAGYPMAALAGAIGARFEKINHYKLGDGGTELKKQHVKFAITVMKITSLLFLAIITVPAILALGALFNA